MLLQLEAALMCSARLEGQFDALLLASKARGHPLVAMGYWAFFQSGLLRAYAIDAQVLIRSVSIHSDGLLLTIGVLLRPGCQQCLVTVACLHICWQCNAHVANQCFMLP